MTTEEACLDALAAAAETLGESPTKAQYESLGLTPSASTILRVVGGWNKAKRRAGLETNPSTGSRVGPKPECVDPPADTDWTDLTQDQRWHYRHIEHNTKRTLKRRQRLRSWVTEQKADRGCSECGECDPACLDIHHPNDEKAMAITEMVTNGYSTDRLEAEIADCEVLCANCHRKRHDRRPGVVREGTDGPSTKRERLQQWAFEYRRETGCQRCSEGDPVCLQFHHPDPERKRASVGAMISDSAPAAEVRDEAKQCVVLCANCHRKEHVEWPDVTDNER